MVHSRYFSSAMAFTHCDFSGITRKQLSRTSLRQRLEDALQKENPVLRILHRTGRKPRGTTYSLQKDSRLSASSGTAGTGSCLTSGLSMSYGLMRSFRTFRSYPSTITCAGIRHSLLGYASAGRICSGTLLPPRIPGCLFARHRSAPACRDPVPAAYAVWCEAQRCIHSRLSTRLSPPGCSLCAAACCYLFLSSLFVMKL